MCGLFGVARLGLEPQPIGTSTADRCRNALHTLTHRGPDAWGEWQDKRAYVGHRRLSIIDTSSHGVQPMVHKRSGHVLAYNGEIYNFRELRAQLAFDYDFESTTDSEVLLHGFDKWGIRGLLGRIEGMFAFAIYDPVRGKLYLARDRVGIKPLYVGFGNSEITFASELKAIVEYSEPGSLTHDPSALYDFLTYGYVPTPKSLYKNVEKLSPAHYLEIDLEGSCRQDISYWSLDDSIGSRSTGSLATELRGQLRDSVREQMIADVPIGFFLSGGIDSSAVTAAAAHHGARQQTFSIGFDSVSHDETAFAEMVADRYQTCHHRYVLSEEEAGNIVEDVIRNYDEPFADSSAVPTYCVSKLAAENVKVALTGDGGDEVFGGYNWYRRFSRAESRKMRFPSFFQPLTRKLRIRASHTPAPLSARIAERLEYDHLLKGFDLYARLMGGLIAREKMDYRNYWEIPEDYDDYWQYRAFYRQDLPVLTRLQYLDFHTYLPDDILTKVDRAAMMVSLETRVPLLSTNLIEFGFGVSEADRYRDGRLKGLLMASQRDELPAAILNRRKKGFSIPQKDWGASLFSSGRTFGENTLHQIYGQFVPPKMRLPS
ncbi:asparagine synthase (glutamine-hydrolyzing) [Pacificimonas sp. WHA3]|uniref:asparagine synthase (glutamine-hydrolyzing) n=1 Tax=Pacificimonas pallii TaxID=2827236 RepID=A0ABS6SGM2_9SPHN|nr:asparagine synthase (glutamine-hydrolyzing) [Pacificimonas pallii]MBV7257573.1 asparagine synthase (glutamine-hydrolyzing) [Pacificimonas pallii]